MVATVIDGKQIAKDIRAEVRVEVDAMKEKLNKVPGLAVVLVGNRPDSATYVRNKTKAAAECGIKVFDVKLPEDISEEDLILKVRELYKNDEVNGLLVQLPLPKHCNERKVLAEVGLDKDVDGFQALNIGMLAMKGMEPFFVPCTPNGCMELLKRSGVEVAGKTAVVLGRSNIVGTPMQMLLTNANATVTVCHSRTPDIEGVCRRADIVICAMGRAEMVKKEWVKEGAVVIDVGMNTKDDPSAKRGYRLCGDADYDDVKDVASQITPVPGGVGPMTIAMLMKNTLIAAQRTHGLLTDMQETLKAMKC
eukprot:TRINITY_DN15438_c0_g1_i1.p3 TRINITY_DN15438_c0_g1~~TRINITY_DN15438_c0_g1_i1.p3  ORF type:complete len:307 (-),score=87.14 TRINITY_DN15438_c0_g1_i1:83-1003(-)